MSSISPIQDNIIVPHHWKTSIGFIVGKGGSGIHAIRNFAGKGTQIIVVNDSDGLPLHFSISVLSHKDARGKMNRAIFRIQQLFQQPLPSNVTKSTQKIHKTSKKKPSFADFLDEDEVDSDQDDELSHQDDELSHQEHVVSKENTLNQQSKILQFTGFKRPNRK